MVNFRSSPSPSQSSTVPSPYLGCRTSVPSFQPEAARGRSKTRPEARFALDFVKPRCLKNCSALRSEERRVGKECRSRWGRDQEKEKMTHECVFKTCERAEHVQ